MTETSTRVYYSCACGGKWTGIGTMHCSGCHENFTGEGPFTSHRKQRTDPSYKLGPDEAPSQAMVGYCIDLAKSTKHEFNERRNAWGGPAMSEETRDRLFGDKE